MARSSVAYKRSASEDVLDQVTDEDVDEALDGDEGAPYELIGDASIPCSRKAGARWKTKIDDALEAYKTEHQKWDLTYVEFRKCGDEGLAALGGDAPYKYHFAKDTDENLVRENVKLILRNSYTRNPKIEISTTVADRKPLAKCLEQAVTALLSRRSYPGLNAKARIRRQIVHGHLTNLGIIKLTYQPKVGSRQEAIQELHKVRKEIASAKDQRTLDDLYAQLEQIEDELPLHNAAGMGLENTLPHRLIIDPKCTNIDLSDADWVVEEVRISTAYIRSRYMEKSDDDGDKWIRKSDGKPAKGDTTPVTDEDSSFSDKIAEQVLGFTSEERGKLLDKGMTRCYIIWDKLTREILLFSDDDWSYPLWVWEDQLKLTRFYQHHLISYNEPIDGVIQPGETSYYVGQTREVNKVNKRMAYIRDLAFGAVIFNSRNQKKETIDRLVQHMENPKEVKAFALDFDPEKKVSDIVHTFVPPDAQFKELYDKSDLMRTIDRVNNTSPSQRGEQFKTNTTNKAIEQYNASTATAVNELTDIVEDSVEELALSMCELLVSKYTKDDMIALVGAEQAANFTPMTADEFNTEFGLTVAAGSTEKPTSENKKKEALNIAQAIGQVGQATPMTSMLIITRMLQEAFSEFLVTDGDMDMMRQEAQAFLTKGVSQPGAAGAGGAPPSQTQPDVAGSGPGGQPPLPTGPVTGV